MFATETEFSAHHCGWNHKYMIVDLEHKYEYNREVCAGFVDEIYGKNNCEIVQVGFQQYLSIMDGL